MSKKNSGLAECVRLCSVILNCMHAFADVAIVIYCMDYICSIMIPFLLFFNMHNIIVKVLLCLHSDQFMGRSRKKFWRQAMGQKFYEVVRTFIIAKYNVY